MTQRTQKQQYLDLLKGIPSDELLHYTYSTPNPYSKRPMLNVVVGPKFQLITPTNEGYIDAFGVEYVGTKSLGGATLPKPGEYILKDVLNWREAIKAPDLTQIDFEQMAHDELSQLEADGIDFTETVKSFMYGGDFFTQFIGFMGFEEGLLAMFEEPDVVKECFAYLHEYYMQLIERSIDYYQPDEMFVDDDIAAYTSPFVTLEQYRTLIKPFLLEEADLARSRGIPFHMHCCGKCDLFVEDWMDYGLCIWDPPQQSNDLAAIQRKYGKNLVLIGGVDMVGELAKPDITEERFKEITRARIDAMLAQNTPYIFFNWQYADESDHIANNKNRWSTEVVEEYGLDHHWKG